ncbi:PhoX family protein [Aquipuribacter nitratireducens]|uniref:PhoX family protein n=1 Tax=Aquipuribacter nitratireducens TaxID=650104 RepID=A0ABW0GLJ4_9MICO
MTIAPESRRLLTVLPMTGRTHGSRSASVCHWKCADACARPDENTSGTERFVDVARQALQRRASRRSVLAGTVAGAALAGLSGIAPAAAAPRPRVAVGSTGAFGFTAIDPVGNTVDDVTVPAGWRWHPIIAWGDPVEAGAPAWDPQNQSAEAQKKQFGYNNDYLDVVPFRGNGNRGLLVANHEYTNDELMFPDYGTTDEAARLRNLETAMYAHGMSVVEVKRRGKGAPWEALRRSRYNRRITLDTQFVLDGPAAGSPLLRTSEDPTGTRVFGTLNNCAGSTTPWGTVLSGEENVDQYFTGPTDPTAREARYGLNTAGRGWGAVQSRFDLRNTATRNEPNRFNWVVELDPENPDEAPVKHTAMGRFKHEGAHVQIAPSGHAVAYSGDDNRFDYLYKFVSRDTFREGPSQAARRHNKTLLSDGDLYVARFVGDGLADGEYDGTGTWLPLVVDGRSMVPGMSVEEVLVYTRVAADTVGATGLDRPEDVEPSPVSGFVYIACTNNTRRTGAQTDEANPRANNKDGHVIELREDAGDPTGRTFTWTILLLCGDPEDESVLTYFGGWDGPVSPISCPDNLAFDDAGNLWVSTDGQPGTIGYNDGLYLVPVEGPERGRVQQFLAVPTGAETCGPQVKAQDGYVLVAVQHPGDFGDASYANPRSTFPYDGVFAGARPACIQVLPA